MNVAWESFLHSWDMGGGQPSGPGHSIGQPNTTSSTSTAEEIALTLPPNTKIFFIVYLVWGVKGKSRNFVQNPFSSLPTPLHPTPPCPQLTVHEIWFLAPTKNNHCFVLFLLTPTVSPPSFIKGLLSVFGLCWYPGSAPMLPHVPCSRIGQSQLL